MENIYTQRSLQSLNDTLIARSLDLGILNLNTGFISVLQGLMTKSNWFGHANSTY